MYLSSAKAMLGIVLFRFPLLPRLWAAWLILINTAGLSFLDTPHGVMVVVCALTGVAVMLVLHVRLGFVRLLGAGHVFWIPMLIWFAFNLPGREDGQAFYTWVHVLFVSNSISLVIDAIDVLRYLRGARAPHYHWRTGDQA